ARVLDFRSTGSRILQSKTKDGQKNSVDGAQASRSSIVVCIRIEFDNGTANHIHFWALCRSLLWGKQCVRSSQRPTCRRLMFDQITGVSPVRAQPTPCSS